QIEKAYGPNNAILDNCHVRVSFATNDERTAKRVSDALGTATEMRAMKNYAGHRLAPWLGHLMVSRQETPRPLLTPGEVMQLPPADEIVMVAGAPPIRAKKVRYFEDQRLVSRILPPPDIARSDTLRRGDDWSALAAIVPALSASEERSAAGEDQANGGLRREPELPAHVAIANEATSADPSDEFSLVLDDDDQAPFPNAGRDPTMVGVARQAALDPGDDLGL
ncbi:type IV secretory system conjugative DNA transfer family protein, partial [Bradyrhizobium sp.]